MNQMNKNNKKLNLPSITEDKYMESFWESLTKNGNYATLVDTVKYVKEYFKHNCPENTTIINICNKLIDDEVAFTTSRSVEDALQEIQPLLLHFQGEEGNESETTSIEVIHIQQYIHMCEEETNGASEYWIAVTNIIHECKSKLNNVFEDETQKAESLKRKRNDEKDSRFHSIQSHIDNGTLNIIVTCELSDQGKKIERSNATKEMEPKKEQIEAAAHLIGSYSSGNPTQINKLTNELANQCKNGIEITDTKILLSSIDHSFQKELVGGGQATLGRKKSKSTQQVGHKNANSCLTDHGQLQTAQNSQQMEEQYIEIFTAIAQSDEVAGFKRSEVVSAEDMQIKFKCCYEQNYLDALARSIAQRNVYLSVKAALKDIESLKKKLNLSLSPNEIGQLNSVSNEWDTQTSHGYMDMETRSPVTKFSYLINCIISGQNCASNILTDCMSVLRDENKSNYFIDMYSEQFNIERYDERQDLATYINTALQQGAERLAKSQTGPPEMDLSDMGFGMNGSGYQEVMQPRNITKRLLHQLYTHASKLVTNNDSNIIRHHLTKETYSEMMSTVDPTKLFDSMMKKIYSELDTNRTKVKIRAPTQNQPSVHFNDSKDDVIEQQANNINIRPNNRHIPTLPGQPQTPKINKRNSMEYSDEVIKLSEAINNKSISIKSFIQQFATTLNSKANKMIVLVNKSNEVIYPLKFSSPEPKYMIPKQLSIDDPSLIIKSLIIKDILKIKLPWLRDNLIPIINALREVAKVENLSIADETRRLKNDSN